MNKIAVGLNAENEMLIFLIQHFAIKKRIAMKSLLCVKNFSIYVKGLRYYHSLLFCYLEFSRFNDLTSFVSDLKDVNASEKICQVNYCFRSS